MPGSFFDSNVLLYVASGDSAKADRAERLIGAGGIISVQVLNEIANVARRKMGMSWTQTAYDRGSRNGAGGRRALRIVGLRRDDRRLGAARRLRHSLVRGYAGRCRARRSASRRQPVSRSVRLRCRASTLTLAPRQSLGPTRLKSKPGLPPCPWTLFPQLRQRHGPNVRHRLRPHRRKECGKKP